MKISYSGFCPAPTTPAHSEGAISPAAIAENHLTTDQSLSARIPHISDCRPVSTEDSTTGAHYALDAARNTLLLVKSNDEWLFESIGNFIAHQAGLNIPGFELVEESCEPLREMMRVGTNKHPVMIFDFLEGVNLRDVDQGSELDPVSAFKELGMAFLVDLVMGNLDRFPGFRGDKEGNRGNILYLPNEQKLVFIDNVSMKHTEHEGRPFKSFMPDDSDARKKAGRGIAEWLRMKFPAMEPSSSNLEAFSNGIAQAQQTLSSKTKEIAKQLGNAGERLNTMIRDVEAAIHNTIDQVAAAVRGQPDAIAHQNELLDIAECGKILKARINVLITDPAQAAALTTRVVDNRGRLPLFHKSPLSEDTAFKDALSKRNAILDSSTLRNKTANIRALTEKHSAHTPLSPDQVDSLVEVLRGTGINMAGHRQTLESLQRERASLSLQQQKLASLIQNFNTFLNNCQQLAPLPLPVSAGQS